MSFLCMHEHIPYMENGFIYKGVQVSEATMPGSPSAQEPIGSSATLRRVLTPLAARLQPAIEPE
eukprot:scaffold36226_cov30-Prasinocladus_malaysianus.AAC.1